MEYYKQLRKMAASMNHDSFKLCMRNFFLYYHLKAAAKEKIDDGLESFVIETIAHHWGYSNNYDESLWKYTERYLHFIESSKNKNHILNEVSLAIANREKQDEFFQNENHFYIIRDESIRKLSKSGEVFIDLENENNQSIYPSNSFKNRLIYEKLEIDTLKTFKSISKILGPKWAIILRVSGGMCTWNGRDFGLEPFVQLTTARVEGDILYNEEVCLAQCALPVTLDLIYEMADDLASHSDEAYHTPQFYEMKKIISSHYLKEELDRKLSVKEPSTSSRGMTAKI